MQIERLHAESQIPDPVVPSSASLTQAQVDAIAAIKALRGMFAGEASLESEFQSARDKETW